MVLTGGAGGASDFKYGSNFRISITGGTLRGNINAFNLLTGAITLNISSNINAAVSHFSSQTGLGTSAGSDTI
jgi:hypothetical protein